MVCGGEMRVSGVEIVAYGVPHPPELRAAVLAALMTGENVSDTAARFGVDRKTVREWRDSYAFPTLPQVGDLEPTDGPPREKVPHLGGGENVKRRRAAPATFGEAVPHLAPSSPPGDSAGWDASPPGGGLTTQHREVMAVESVSEGSAGGESVIVSESYPVAATWRERNELRLGELVARYLHESIITLTAQIQRFRDPGWLAAQPAGELAILHGVIADKTIRILASLQPDDAPDIDADTTIDAGPRRLA